MQLKECIVGPLGYSCINKIKFNNFNNFNNFNKNLVSYIFLRSCEIIIINIINLIKKNSIQFNISDYPEISFN